MRWVVMSERELNRFEVLAYSNAHLKAYIDPIIV